MFISAIFELKGLAPSHYLYVKEDNNTQVAASLLLKFFIDERLYQPEIKVVLSEIKPVKILKTFGKLTEKYLLELNS